MALTRRPARARGHAQLADSISDSCTLDRSELPRRLEDWRHLLADCDITREGTGATITLRADTDVVAVAELAAAETACCSFFTFELRVDATGNSLRVTAPEAQQSMIDLLVGTTP